MNAALSEAISYREPVADPHDDLMRRERLEVERVDEPQLAHFVHVERLLPGARLAVDHEFYTLQKNKSVPSHTPSAIIGVQLRTGSSGLLMASIVIVVSTGTFSST